MLCFSVSMVLDPSQCFCSQEWPAEQWQVQQRMRSMTLTSLPLEVVLVVSELPDLPQQIMVCLLYSTITLPTAPYAFHQNFIVTDPNKVAYASHAC